jgi:hypothetical protein
VEAGGDVADVVVVVVSGGGWRWWGDLPVVVVHSFSLFLGPSPSSSSCGWW